MKIADIISAICSFAPLRLQEKWDNSGLQAGNPSASCTGVLLCVDVTEDVIAEAVSRGCNLVVSHHPLLFHGVKSLTGATPEQRALIAAVKSDVAVFSSHTALDSAPGGISRRMAEMIGAIPEGPLCAAPPQGERITVCCPRDKAADVSALMLDIASECVVTEAEAEALGSPAVLPDGFLNIEHSLVAYLEAEVSADNKVRIADALVALPAEPSPRIVRSVPVTLRPEVGLGIRARFDEPVPFGELAERVRKAFGCGRLRVSQPADEAARITRVALCGGSGGEFIPRAIASGAQVYVSADIRYHDFASFGSSIIIVDAGHFETESCAKDIFYGILSEKFPNFAIYLSETEKNPVKYL